MFKNCLQAATGFVPFVRDNPEVAERLQNGFYIASDLWTSFWRNLMSFFDCDYTTIRPGALGNRIQSRGKITDSDVEITAASADRPQQTALAKLACVAVCHQDVKCHHAALDSDKRIFP